MSEQAQVNAPAQPQTQPPTQPTPVTPEVPSQKAPQEDMAAKFAALAKKERIARQQAQKIKQLEAQIAEREKQIIERERLWDEEFKKSPLDAIKKRGYSYEDLTKAALNDGKFQPETEIKEVRSEIERIRQEQAEKERKALESQKAAAQRAEQEAIDRFKTNISNHLESNKDKYELTSLYEAEDLVFQTVEEHYMRTQKEGKPRIMSLDEACSAVEGFLEQELERTAQASKKFKSKYQALKAKEEAKEKAQAARSSTTLTNDLTPSTAAPSLLPPATESDRIKRALAALG